MLLRASDVSDAWGFCHECSSYEIQAGMYKSVQKGEGDHRHHNCHHNFLVLRLHHCYVQSAWVPLFPPVWDL